MSERNRTEGHASAVEIENTDLRIAVVRAKRRRTRAVSNGPLRNSAGEASKCHGILRNRLAMAGHVHNRKKVLSSAVPTDTRRNDRRRCRAEVKIPQREEQKNAEYSQNDSRRLHNARWQFRLTSTRSATAAGSARGSQWKCFAHGKCGHKAGSRSLHRWVRRDGWLHRTATQANSKANATGKRNSE
jgi:hypothetical protein